MKSKITAALLAFFLGGFGAHKFYVDQTGTGFLYLLFSWTGIPFLLSVFEGVSYLTMSDRAFQHRYGKLHHLSNQPTAPQSVHSIVDDLPDTSGVQRISDELSRLEEMRQTGLLSEDEFQEQKHRLLL